MKRENSLTSLLKNGARIAMLLVMLTAAWTQSGVRQSGLAVQNMKRIQPPKQIIVLLCDALRWDYISASGNGKARTPNIDSLAREGIIFRNAYTVCPISAPSYATLFTSLLPFEHGLSNNAQPLPAHIPYLPEKLHEQGFFTAAFISNYFCGNGYGFKRGYDTFRNVDEVGKHSWTLARQLLPWLEYRTSGTQPLFLFVSYMDLHEPYSLPNAPRWLQIRFDGEIIKESACPELDDTLWMQLDIPPGTHSLSFERALPPLRPEWKPKYDFTPIAGSGVLNAGVEIEFSANTSEPRAGARTTSICRGTDEFPVIASLKNTTDKTISGELVIRISRRYNAEQLRTIYPRSVENLDYEIGKVINMLRKKDLLDETLIVLLSDHGEGLGDHGLKGHIENLYDSLMHVPLIMRYPPLGKGIVVDDIISLIDVTPTICDLLGKPWPSRFGQSLLPMIFNSSAQGRQWVFAETSPPEAEKRITCLRTRTTKLIVDHTSKKIEFYDLIKDPSELKDLYSGSASEASKALESYCRLFNLCNPFEELSSGRQMNLESLSQEEIERLKSLGYVK